VNYENELRLLYAIVLNAVALAAAYRFARRRLGGDVVRRCIDAGLIYYLLQYAVVGGLGLVGLLSPWTIGPLALMLCALLWVASGWRHDERKIGPAPTPEVPRGDRVVIFACLAFVIAYAGAYIYQQSPLPPTADDALTYHLPAAVQWLQTGRIGLLPTWFFNPANAYSPLGGSIFMAWLIAPIGSDLLVRYVQLGPLILLFFVVLEIARLLGARNVTAALVATACVMVRSFVNQVIVPKDDLFLTAFATAAVISLAPQRADESGSPWRAGVALGLLLSIKYTAMYSLPILLLMGDVPFRHARWRRWGWLIAPGIALAIAGPWYVRNAVLTGNPLFPIDAPPLLHGLFATSRSTALSTPAGVYDVLIGGRGFFGTPTTVMLILLLGWLAGLVLRWRSTWRDALWRACLLGSMASIVLFALTAPYPELRFIYPAIALLFAVSAGMIALLGRRQPWADVAGGGVLFVVVLITTVRGPGTDKLSFTLAGLIAAAAMVALLGLTPQRSARRVRWAVVGAFSLVCTGLIYVNWAAYHATYLAGRFDAWAGVSGPMGEAWRAVDRDLPPGSVVAYVGTHFVYPLQGSHLRNRVVYAPVRPGLHAMRDLPRASRRLSGEEIPAYFTAKAQAGADGATWRANLVAAGANAVFIAKNATNPPPELAFIAQHPAAFELIHDGPAAAVYRVRDAALLAD
jgi:hypothetical protein